MLAIVSVAFAYGAVAGIFLGAPAFVLGLLAGLAALAGTGFAAGVAATVVLLDGLALAVALQVGYVVGLVARSRLPDLRRSSRGGVPGRIRGEPGLAPDGVERGRKTE